MIQDINIASKIMDKTKEYQPKMDYINEEREVENSVTKRRRNKKMKIEDIYTFSDNLSRESTPKKVYDNFKRRMMFHIQKHQGAVKPKSKKKLVRPKFIGNYIVGNFIVEGNILKDLSEKQKAFKTISNKLVQKFNNISLSKEFNIRKNIKLPYESIFQKYENLKSLDDIKFIRERK